nr:417_t:CDS:2 [Entrophospora candida]
MASLNANKKAENNYVLLNSFRHESSSNEEVRITTVLLVAIDTMGIGDRRLTPQEILYNFAETVGDIKGGFNQILFVTDGRFREEEIDAYYLLQSVIFGRDIVNFTTIVRTKFPDFEDDTECEQDRLDMIKENDKLSTIIKECKKVIHVDNPPITHRTMEGAKETREESRKKILNHLNTCKNIYYPPNLVEINVRIKEYMTGIEKLENELEDLKRQMAVVYNPSTSSDDDSDKKPNKSCRLMRLIKWLINRVHGIFQ